jgi:glutamate dehydrogenase
MDRGVPEDAARAHADLPVLGLAPTVIAVAQSSGRSIDDVARVCLRVGDALFIDWLEERLRHVPTSTRWHRWALQAVEDDLLLARRRATERVLAEGEGTEPDEAVEAFLTSRAAVIERLRRFMSAFALEEVSDLAAVTVAVRQIRGAAA